jgi:hypothetical protein
MVSCIFVLQKRRNQLKSQQQAIPGAPPTHASPASAQTPATTSSATTGHRRMMGQGGASGSDAFSSSRGSRRYKSKGKKGSGGAEGDGVMMSDDGDAEFDDDNDDIDDYDDGDSLVRFVYIFLFFVSPDQSFCCISVSWPPFSCFRCVSDFVWIFSVDFSQDEMSDDEDSENLGKRKRDDLDEFASIRQGHVLPPFGFLRPKPFDHINAQEGQQSIK